VVCSRVVNFRKLNIRGLVMLSNAPQTNILNNNVQLGRKFIKPNFSRKKIWLAEPQPKNLLAGVLWRKNLAQGSNCSSRQSRQLLLIPKQRQKQRLNSTYRANLSLVSCHQVIHYFDEEPSQCGGTACKLTHTGGLAWHHSK